MLLFLLFQFQLLRFFSLPHSLKLSEVLLVSSTFTLDPCPFHFPLLAPLFHALTLTLVTPSLALLWETLLSWTACQILNYTHFWRRSMARRRNLEEKSANIFILLALCESILQHFLGKVLQFVKILSQILGIPRQRSYSAKRNIIRYSLRIERVRNVGKEKERLFLVKCNTKMKGENFFGTFIIRIA